MSIQEPRQQGTSSRPPAPSPTSLSAARTPRVNEHVIVEQAKESQRKRAGKSDEVRNVIAVERGQGQTVSVNKLNHKKPFCPKSCTTVYFVAREERRKNCVSKSEERWGEPWCLVGGDIESAQFQGQHGNITLRRYEAMLEAGEQAAGDRRRSRTWSNVSKISNNMKREQVTDFLCCNAEREEKLADRIGLTLMPRLRLSSLGSVLQIQYVIRHLLPLQTQRTLCTILVPLDP